MGCIVLVIALSEWYHLQATTTTLVSLVSPLCCCPPLEPPSNFIQFYVALRTP